MPLVNMKPLLRDAMNEGYAVAAFNLNLKHVFVESFVNYHKEKPSDFEPLRVMDAQCQACKAMFAGFIEKFGGKDRGTAFLNSLSRAA